MYIFAFFTFFMLRTIFSIVFVFMILISNVTILMSHAVLYLLHFSKVTYLLTNVVWSAVLETSLFDRLTRTDHLYNECLPWYNVVLTSLIHLSVKYRQQLTVTPTD